MIRIIDSKVVGATVSHGSFQASSNPFCRCTKRPATVPKISYHLLSGCKTLEHFSAVVISWQVAWIGEMVPVNPFK